MKQQHGKKPLNETELITSLGLPHFMLLKAEVYSRDQKAFEFFLIKNKYN